ncbi:PREDICTED: TBC1 domain family member 31-like [Amphimedon queenslandica]|uniref:TBC1 domain family member 31 n=1 Tax=Amphimedon queenslandica TaxID=400682 RepID=A0AAN0IWY1_AMPQE|nr:PREDICTED: TBC1 domain family member 31-like [Amphimedon queenslandica]|eukprot:XP_019849062.1 PREDICTED: TBC1 domain family member 31-like [Amphimedon queenslandica]
MESIDLCGGDGGSIWGRKPTPREKDGFLLSIRNTRIGLTAAGRHVPFTRVTFGCHGNWFIATDQLGVIYSFDVYRNKYQVVYRLGKTCTALLISHTYSNELFVATNDLNVHCINIGSRQLITTFGPHEASIKSLSLPQSGQYLLVVTACDSVLWDINTGIRRKTLCGGESVGVQDVFFLPLTNSIITCFKDDSIHVWDTSTLDYKYNLPLPSGPPPHYRAFATTQDGSFLVAGGRSNILYIWSMKRHVLEHVIQLPSKVKNVKQLLFVPGTFDGHKSQVLGMLAQDGLLRFVSVTGCQLLFTLGGKDEELISMAHIDPMGRHVAAVTEQGSLLIYDLSHSLKAHHLPSLTVSELFQVEKSSSQVSKLSSSSTSVPDPPVKPVSKTSQSAKRGETSSAGGGVSLNLAKLRSILRGYGEYPAKYRSFIWRSLLQLPLNHMSYSTLLDKGTHSAYIDIGDKYPIKSQKLLRILQRTLSALSHWSPLFSEVDYLPPLIFPFVKHFQNNQLVIFEMVATILFNWCSHWFEYFPNPPLNVLSLVENLLSHHDNHLLQHFVSHNITAQVYAWPLLQTLFSEALSKEEWLKLWDNVLSQPPSFLLMVAAAYISCARSALLKCTTVEDVEYFMRHQSTVNLKVVLQDAYRMQEATPPAIHPHKTLGDFVPLTSGAYPIFNKYPKYIVNYQLQEKERIRREEQEYLRQRQQTLELERLAEQRRQEDEAWQRQHELLLQAESQRKKMLELEEEKLSDQRARLAAMKREAKLKELKSLDDARQKYLQQQQTLRELEIEKMDKEIEKKVLLRDKETQEAIEEVEIRSLELQAQRACLERELLRRHELAMYRLRNAHEVERERTESERFSPPSKIADIQEAQSNMIQLENDLQARNNEDIALACRELRSLQNDLKEQNLQAAQEKYKEEEKKLETAFMKLQTMKDSSSSEEISSINPPDNNHTGAGQWPHHRKQLNGEETQLLHSVHNLRRRIAQHMRDSTSPSLLST